MLMLIVLLCCRFRIVRQPGERPGGDPGHERLPDRHEASEGPAEEAEGREPTLLTTALAPARATLFIV